MSYICSIIEMLIVFLYVFLSFFVCILISLSHGAMGQPVFCDCGIA